MGVIGSLLRDSIHNLLNHPECCVIADFVQVLIQRLLEAQLAQVVVLLVDLQL